MTEQQIALLVKDNERLIQLLDIVLLRNRQLEYDILQLTGANGSFSFLVNPKCTAESVALSYVETDEQGCSAVSSHLVGGEVAFTSCSSHTTSSGMASHTCFPPSNGAGQDVTPFASSSLNSKAALNTHCLHHHAANGIAMHNSNMPAGNNGTQDAITDRHNMEGRHIPVSSLQSVSPAQGISTQNSVHGSFNSSMVLKEINRPSVEIGLRTIMRTASLNSLQNTAIILIELYESKQRLSMKNMQKLTGLSASGITKRIMSMKKFGLVMRVRSKGLVVTDKTIRILEASRV